MDIPPSLSIIIKPTPSDAAASEFFHGFLAHHPVVPTSSTPIYSNAAFQILGYVLEAITNQNYSSLLVKDIIQPLNLTRSSYTPPDNQFGITPVNESYSGWRLDLGDEGP
jgi:CubicO group peptidase (beta-lactamase class C family)